MTTLPTTRKKIKLNFNIAIKNGDKFHVKGIYIYAKNKNIIWESMHTGGGLDESK